MQEPQLSSRARSAPPLGRKFRLEPQTQVELDHSKQFDKHRDGTRGAPASSRPSHCPTPVVESLCPAPPLCELLSPLSAFIAPFFKMDGCYVLWTLTMTCSPPNDLMAARTPLRHHWPLILAPALHRIRCSIFIAAGLLSEIPRADFDALSL